MQKKPKRKRKRHTIDCSACRTQSDCCAFGTWVDLDEAKKILGLKIRKGDFYHLVKDGDYPSGFRTSTSIMDNTCTFLTTDGLCSIHKISYGLKPAHCKEFPYENSRLSYFAKYLCAAVRSKNKRSGR